MSGTNKKDAAAKPTRAEKAAEKAAEKGATKGTGGNQ